MLLIDTRVLSLRQLRLVSSCILVLPAYFSSDQEQVPSLTFEVLKDERLDLVIWQRVAWLLMKEKDDEANALLEEFGLAPLWDEPLD